MWWILLLLIWVQIVSFESDEGILYFECNGEPLVDSVGNGKSSGI